MDMSHRGGNSALADAPLGADAGPQLAALVGRLHRALRKCVRENMPGPALPQSQIEVVRLLHQAPGLRVHEVSTTLGLAPNTASTLIQQLARLGFVERRVDDQDRRAVRLELTEAARQRMERWRDTRGQVLANTLATLSAADSERLQAALPALERLSAALEGSAR